MLEGEGSIKAEQLASAVDQRDGGDSSDAAAVAGELSAEAAIEADLKPTKAAGAAAAAISLAGGSRTEAAKLAAGVAGRAALEEGLPPTAAAEAAVRATQEVKRPESQAAFAADVGHSVASVYATAGAAPEVAAKAAEEAVRGSGGDRRQAALLGGQAASAAALSRGEELADLGRDVLKSALLTGATNAEAGELADAAQDAAVASRGIRSAQQLEDGRAAVDAMLVSDGTPTQHNHLVQHTRRGQQQQQQQQQLEPITVQSVDTQVMKILKQAATRRRARQEHSLRPLMTTAAPVEASHDEDPAGGVVNGVQKAGEAIVSVGSATRQAGENAATRLAEAGESAREAGEAAVWAVGDAARSHITKNIEARGENKAAARTIREIVAKAMDQRKDTGSEDASAVSKPHHAGCHEAVKLRLDTSPQQTGEDAAAAARGAGQNQAEVAKAAGVAAGEMAVAEGLLPDQAAGIAWDSARKAGGTKREAIIAAAEVAGHAAAAKGETPAMVAKVTAKAVKAAGGCQADVANAAGIAADKVAKARGVAPRVAERIADEAAAAATASAKPNVQVQQHRHSDGGRYRARFRAPPHAKDGGTKAFVRAVGRAAARAAASEELSVAKAARVIANAVYAAGGDGDDVAVTVGASIGSAGARARITPLHAAQAARKLFEMEGGTHTQAALAAGSAATEAAILQRQSERHIVQEATRSAEEAGGSQMVVANVAGAAAEQAADSQVDEQRKRPAAALAAHAGHTAQRNHRMLHALPLKTWHMAQARPDGIAGHAHAEESVRREARRVAQKADREAQEAVDAEADARHVKEEADAKLKLAAADEAKAAALIHQVEKADLQGTGCRSKSTQDVVDISVKMSEEAERDAIQKLQEVTKAGERQVLQAFNSAEVG
eukprot:TRINITY_DN13576_c1_g1_i4.p1 TRINITY_DN13576_c1_g1~~TRINITY_DN13576_c1_g1_i4.p1  ORF type:complete len:895 (-),score=300.34 TRINITY_DN13576_c1_g1_i4:124-2808(-)